MAEKTSVGKPMVKVLGNPDENKRVVSSAEKSLEQSTEAELKKTQTFPIPKGDNVHTFITGQMTTRAYTKVKAKRRMQRAARKRNRK